MAKFQLVSPFPPAGDQPQAIESLVDGLRRGKTASDLMGVTGSGKTFTMANVIAQYGRPALVMSHNKTLAAQLYAEFKDFFPHNAVRYFVSYYDYYQPEAYIPQRDIYIEKDAAINDEIERLRLACTSALVSRDDVIVVASVSCIYGLGSPEDYRKMMVRLRLGDVIDRDEMLLKFVDIQYDRNDVSLRAGQVPRAGRRRRALAGLRGDRLPDRALRRRGRAPGRRSTRSPATCSRRTRRCTSTRPSTSSCPRSGSRGPSRAIQRGAGGAAQAAQGAGQAAGSPAAGGPDPLRHGDAPGGRLLLGDRELLAGTSRAASRARRPTRCSTSSRPTACSSSTSRTSSVPQIRGMFAGDFSRKSTLVEHGFRLPSALDNRPLRFDEWEKKFEPAAVTSRPRPATTRSRCPAARSSSR